MTSRQNNQIRLGNQISGLTGISSVQHLIAGKGHIRQRESCRGIRTKMTGHVMILRVRANEQRPRLRRQSGAQPLHKIVGIAEYGPVRPLHVRAAGDEYLHTISPCILDL